jgi:hypothetical protein
MPWARNEFAEGEFTAGLRSVKNLEGPEMCLQDRYAVTPVEGDGTRRGPLVKDASRLLSDDALTRH